MQKKEKFNIVSLKNLADAFDYDIDQEQDKWRLLRKDSRIQVHIESIEEDVSAIYLVLKIFSFDLPGDRTDFTDVLSVLFAAFLRVIDFNSLNTIDIGHPCLEERSCIYGKLMFFGQPNKYICNDEKLLDRLSEILFCIDCFYAWICPIQAKMEKATNCVVDQMSFDKWSQISTEVSLQYFGDADDCNIIHRKCPSWYYSNFYNEISIVACPELIRELKRLYENLYEVEYITGIDSKLHISKKIRNAVPGDIFNTGYNIIASFEKEKELDIQCIPTDNSLILLSENHLVAMKCCCGLDQFELEREKIEHRHKLEHELLFSVSNITWSESIKGSEFEDFILELLNKEEGVFLPRKVGNTNSPDGGRDIICEWFIPKKQIDIDNDRLYEKKKVIVQCKAFKKSVGKSDVIDIRDMLEYYNADGFLLATSSQITSPLTDHLMSLKKKYWVNWWTRSEIEYRVNKYQDMISSFPDILTISR